MIAIEHILPGASVMLVLSIVASRLSEKLGVPALLTFLVIGMLAGSRIHFDERGPWVPVGRMAKQSLNSSEADRAMGTDTPGSTLGVQADQK
jgi:Kef-type K+ transport system membrane component KefB